MAVVLVASHDETVRDLVTAEVTRAGHDVVTAPDGIAAMTLIRRSKPDVTVLDSDLPGVSAEGVWHIVRAYPSTARVGVVLLTDPAALPPHPAGGESHLTAALRKPVSAGDVTDQVGALLRRAAACECDRNLF